MKIKVSYQPTYKEVLEALGAVPEIDCNKLLKKIERLQEQLEEANEIIQTLYKRKECDGFDYLIFGMYLEKWGVK